MEMADEGGRPLLSAGGRAAAAIDRETPWPTPMSSLEALMVRGFLGTGGERRMVE